MSMFPCAQGLRRRRAMLSLETLDRREMLAGDALLAAALVGPRSIDGTNNNLRQAEWGSTGEQLLRMSAAEYADGASTPGGQDRPSPRAISNTLVALDPEAAPNERQMSAFIYVWGQFLDHDIDLTETQTAGGEKFSVAVPAGDPFFDPTGSGSATIPLTRSQFDPATGGSSSNPRQQMNSITAWVDGSMIYGSSAATATSLRTFRGGKLLVSTGEMPPADANGNFYAGDVRVNENIELTSMHTLFLREHNRWASRIARDNPRLSDEAIYQRARAIVIAEVQAITYNEFLPALLGREAISRYGGYDARVNPTIANEFSTAAFRLGHSLINDDVEFFGNDGRAVRDEVELRDAFNNPGLLRETGIDSILKYSASTQAQELDNMIVEGLRNFLFGMPGQGGLDLASLNIQRGRDHGLADYNAVRAAYGLSAASSFSDITSDAAVAHKLSDLYGSVDNIDLWVGLLAEDHLPGSSVGELTSAIIADQFERLRDGDRFWYQRTFSSTARSQIEQTSLADIIERNTTVRGLQDNVFFMRGEISGQVFNDRSGNGRIDRGEAGLAGVSVELLDDEGEVVATAVTDRSGQYRFTNFGETGDYQVRIVLPTGMVATTRKIADVLLPNGDTKVRNLNFGVRRGAASGQTAVSRELAVDAILAGIS